MEYKLDTRLTIFLTLVAFTAAINFQVTPVNVAVKAGERIEFSCTHSGALKGWVEYITSKVPGNIKRIILTGAILNGPRKNSYDLTENNDLVIKSVKKEDAGRYACEDLSSSEFAMVFVLYLASDPSCTHNITETVEAGSVVGVTCKVAYTGAWAPVVDFSDQNDNRVDESTPGQMKYTLNYEVGTGDSGKIIEAITKFPAPPSDVFVNPLESNTVVYARNSPAYTFTYNEAVLRDIHYGPTNLRFNASGDITIGTVLGCTADAKPATITFKIFNKTKDNIISNTPSIEVTADMLGEQTIGCIATNYILGNHERTVEKQETFTVSEVRTANVKAIGAGVGAAVLIIIVICFLGYKFYQNKQHNDSMKQTKDEEKQQQSSLLEKEKMNKENDCHITEKKDNDAPEDDQYDDPKKRNAENLNYAELNLNSPSETKKPENDNNLDSTTYAQVQRT